MRPVSVLVEIFKVIIGGFVGVVLAIALLWYGFGIDPFRLMSRANNARNRDQVADASTSANATPHERERLPKPADGQQPELPVEKSPRRSPGRVRNEANEGGNTRATPETTPSAPVEQKKVAVPSADAQRTAVEELGVIFKEEYDAAKTPAEKSQIAELLYRQAQQIQNDTTARFVTLREAYEHATAAGNLELAAQVVEELLAGYELDALAVRTRMVFDTASAVRTPAEQRGVVIAALNLVDVAIGEKQFEAATKLASLSDTLALKARDSELQRRARAVGNQVEELKQQWAAVQQAMSTLEENPDDADANRTYGRHLCLSEGNWAMGLEMLVKSGQSPLIAAAELDLANPAEHDKHQSDTCIRSGIWRFRC
jgi:hypothetical protein